MKKDKFTSNRKINELEFANKLTRLMDDKFRFPGTNFRFGLDPILNLLPGVGDVFTLFISLLIVYIISKNATSRKVIYLMLLNIFFDFALGAIPIVGQIADFFVKSNRNNIKLLNEHYYEGKHQGKGTWIIILLIISLLIVGFLFVYLFWIIISWIIDLIY